MSDILTTPIQITGADVVSYANEKWANQVCGRCGSDHWVVGDEDKFMTLLPVAGADIMALLKVRFTMPAVWLVCQGCGKIEFIAASAITVWKAGRPA